MDSNNIIKRMLEKYKIENDNDKVNALKEVIQELMLSGLSRQGFFNEAAFYGEAALRIFYGLDRFSEDLDFALLETNLDFDIEKYFKGIEDEMSSYGFNMKISKKEKTKESNIDSAFLKADTKELIINFFPNDEVKNNGFYKDIKIKFEIDINPPKGAEYEIKNKIMPYIHQVKLYDIPSLFAGKIHAILCRDWKTRTKGRDLYDYIFYMQKSSTVNMNLLKNKLIASNVLKESDEFNNDVLANMLIDKFNNINFEESKNDVYGFLHENIGQLDFWNKETFQDLTKKYFK